MPFFYFYYSFVQGMSVPSKRTTISHQVATKGSNCIKIIFSVLFNLMFLSDLVGICCQPANAAYGLRNWVFSTLPLTGKIVKQYFIFSCRFKIHNSVTLQLTKEDILTSDELGWFPGSLVLGQVLGILLGPLLADLVNTLAVQY